MVCLPSDDILGSTGVSVLRTLTISTTLEDVAQKTGLPLFRVRGTVRRLMESGLTRQIDQMYEITPEGIEALVKKSVRTSPNVAHGLDDPPAVAAATVAEESS